MEARKRQPKRTAAEHLLALHQRGRRILLQALRPTQDEAIWRDYLNYGREPLREQE